jgi:hypothetical protein
LARTKILGGEMEAFEAVDQEQLGEVISAAKMTAKKYRQLTGRPLGVTGEVGEFEAVRLLGLRLAAVRQPGYDAVREEGSSVCRVQIKARCVLPDSGPGQRIGRIRLDREWDSVILVLLDDDLEPIEIYEAKRPEIEAALLKPGSKARNDRGALGVRKFKSIAQLVWSHKEAIHA